MTSELLEEQYKTRERIIAASKVLAEKRYDATTLREISREVQPGLGLVYYYFDGKDQLLVDALQAASRRFQQRMEYLVQQVPADPSFEVVLIQLSEPVEQEPEVNCFLVVFFKSYCLLEQYKMSYGSRAWKRGNWTQKKEYIL